MTWVMKILKNIPICLLGLILLISCEKKKESGLPVDGDGNEYDTVVIGTQTWLSENLKTTKYNNGFSIPLITDNTQWASMSMAAYCWYGNNPAFKESYGALYNQWTITIVYSLCPVGYHVPSDDEWKALINYLGGEEVAGAKLKATGTQFWINNNNSITTNESGFTALPGGMRDPNDGTFKDITVSGFWWSASAGHRVYINESPGSYLGGLSPKSGFSVRCIKDN
jgi:uncharacterized protein (TIGR02145 family)